MLRKFNDSFLPVSLLWTLALLTLPCGSKALSAEVAFDHSGGYSQAQCQCQNCRSRHRQCQHCRAGHRQGMPNQGTPVFSNYYVSGGAYGVPSDMYPAPHPTPPIIGHVYYTYQPFMPHEMLYTHHRNYTTYDSNYQVRNRTSVKWTSGHYRRTHLKILH